MAVLLRPGMPPDIARDAVQHTWKSYSDTMLEMILAARTVAWLDQISVPVTLIAGVHDNVPNLELLAELADDHPNVSFEPWPDADHDVPLTDPDKCVAAIASALRMDADGVGPSIVAPPARTAAAMK